MLWTLAIKFLLGSGPMDGPSAPHQTLISVKDNKGEGISV